MSNDIVGSAQLDGGMMTGESGQKSHYRLREDLVESLRTELLGPAGGTDERIPQSPTSRYLVGRLAPAGTAVAAIEDDGGGAVGADSDDAEVENESPLASALNPSSIGLSMVVGESESEVEVCVTWGEYTESVDEVPPAANETQENLSIGDDDELSGDVSEDGDEPDARRQWNQRWWVRIPQEFTVRLQLSNGDGVVELPAEGIRLEYVCRPISGGKALSLFIVNRRSVPADSEFADDELWIFQPTLKVSTVGEEPAIVARDSDVGMANPDPEVRSNELLYWNSPEFAVGHGTSASWDAEIGARMARSVWSEIIPQWELPRVDPKNQIDVELRMAALGGAGSEGVPGNDLSVMLMPLVNLYEAWIDEHLSVLLDDVPENLKDVAREHISYCQIARDRMVEGIRMLEAGPDEIRRAFCFANRAMALQRERSEVALARRQGRKPEIRDPRWRPFQIAFILINLPGLADRKHNDREVADLLWFPTGGGKTEAYLGLAAFNLAFRRVRKPLDGMRNDVGVAVIMRYTLRLLTVQQFQRAASLICACEYLRRSESAWGDERFSIGLWVGRGATPNDFDDAKKVLDELAADDSDFAARGRGSPVQLLSCPWCGDPLLPRDPQRAYAANKVTEDVEMACRAHDCEFGPQQGGLPVHTVDAQIYRRVPSLVVATVDKFARMPFNGRVQALFGHVNRFCPRHGFLTAGHQNDHAEHSHNAKSGYPAVDVVESLRLEPPDLIIQDELHLISGPLGTIVGAYEAAVDHLASANIDDDVLRPKVIASTATIRRARVQTAALFDRRLQIFPPSGLTAADSWFGSEVPVSETNPGRRYLGVYGPGKSVKTAIVRVYAALLSRAEALRQSDPQSSDAYMTLVGYFNSLRELGGAIRLVEDDIPSRIRVLNQRDSATWPRRILYSNEELTSNKRAEEVPEILGLLERKFGVDRDDGPAPVDTLLASNMISVGVDVDRLGLMVVNGQPKTTAEYIQATSRVGRQAPGLVVTVYNWSRPRDTSHYERFRSYHSSIYRHVEATSVTPFSSRARDKTLEGVLSSLLRLSDPSLTPEPNAGTLDRQGQHVADLVSVISKRAGRVASATGENPAVVAAATRDELQQDLDNWDAAQQAHGRFTWTRLGVGPYKQNEIPHDWGYLVQSQEDDMQPEGVFSAPGSLREVEGEVPVYLENLAGGGADEGDPS